ncbi:hypothetical protein GIB67_012223 [Kingdonia uniflora]|uniref:SMP domain-containing protein n=1 Tax=Kingdonia uniflora TaxID=39325 RepID=A0A7J7NVG2_9MAGN|nr:hypothetical protein GIB67_012223 [Kingdonia uniflora]
MQSAANQNERRGVVGHYEGVTITEIGLPGGRVVTEVIAGQVVGQHAEATPVTVAAPGGVGATAQSAATYNARIVRDDNKTKLGDVLTDAASKLPRDKPVTRQDAEGVMGAELRKNLNLTTHPSGVTTTVVAVARLNENR